MSKATDIATYLKRNIDLLDSKGMFWLAEGLADAVIREAASSEPDAWIRGHDLECCYNADWNHKQTDYYDMPIFTHPSISQCSKPDDYFCVYAEKGKEF